MIYHFQLLWEFKINLTYLIDKHFYFQFESIIFIIIVESLFSVKNIKQFLLHIFDTGIDTQ